MKDIRGFLERNNVPFDEIGNDLVVGCPFCKNIATGIMMQSYLMNKKTGNGECQMCKRRTSLEEFAKAMRLNVDLNEIDTSIKPTVENQEKEKRQKRFYHLWSMTEILKHKFSEQEWVIDKLLPVQTITVLSGNPQNFKTWVTIELAKSVALGTAFLGHFQVTQGAVLIVNEEDHLRYLQKRFTLFGITGEAPIHLLSQEGVKIDKDEWLIILRSLIHEHSIRLIILDSFIRIHSCRENDAVEMAYVLDRLRELTKEGTTVLITHHHRKGKYGPEDPSQSIRGSSDIAAAVDCHLSVEKREDEIFVRQNKLRVDEVLPPFRITISRSAEGKFEALTYGGECKVKEHARDKAKPIILDVLKDREHDREELYNKVKSVSGIGDVTIGDALRKLTAEKEVKVRVGRYNKKFYSINDESENKVF